MGETEYTFLFAANYDFNMFSADFLEKLREELLIHVSGQISFVVAVNLDLVFLCELGISLRQTGRGNVQRKLLEVGCELSRKVFFEVLVDSSCIPLASFTSLHSFTGLRRVGLLLLHIRVFGHGSGGISLLLLLPLFILLCGFFARTKTIEYHAECVIAVLNHFVLANLSWSGKGDRVEHFLARRIKTDGCLRLQGFELVHLGLHVEEWNIT